MSNLIKPWKVVDLLNLAKGEMNKESEYFLARKEASNSSGVMYWVGDDEKMPLINEWLLNNGFEKGEQLLFWVSW